jgi:hypothetical protein
MYYELVMRSGNYPEKGTVQEYIMQSVYLHRERASLAQTHIALAAVNNGEAAGILLEEYEKAAVPYLVQQDKQSREAKDKAMRKQVDKFIAEGPIKISRSRQITLPKLPKK